VPIEVAPNDENRRYLKAEISSGTAPATRICSPDWEADER
jgi:hypothetical protein